MCHDLFYSSLNRHSNILQVLAKKQQFRSRKHWARNWLQPLWNKVLWPRSLKELIRNPLKPPWLSPVSRALTVLTNTSALEREGLCAARGARKAMMRWKGCVSSDGLFMQMLVQEQLCARYYNWSVCSPCSPEAYSQVDCSLPHILHGDCWE